MRTVRFSLAALLLGAVSFGAYRADDAPKYTIKEVMKAAHKDGLLKKVTDGTATKAEKDQLVSLYTALAANKPKKGDVAVWKEKTTPIVAAAKAIAADKDTPKATDDLKNATKCADCHSVFK